MSRVIPFENDWLKLIFPGDGHCQHRGQCRDLAADEPLRFASHSRPADAGNQTTNETAYTSYARVAVARTSGGWTVTGNSVSPTANIDFPGLHGRHRDHHAFLASETASSGTGKLLQRDGQPRISRFHGRDAAPYHCVHCHRGLTRWPFPPHVSTACHQLDKQRPELPGTRRSDRHPIGHHQGPGVGCQRA